MAKMDRATPHVMGEVFVCNVSGIAPDASLMSRDLPFVCPFVPYV
jgi:hypothetical protein